MSANVALLDCRRVAEQERKMAERRVREEMTRDNDAVERLVASIWGGLDLSLLFPHREGAPLFFNLFGVLAADFEALMQPMMLIYRPQNPKVWALNAGPSRTRAELEAEIEKKMSIRLGARADELERKLKDAKNRLINGDNEVRFECSGVLGLGSVVQASGFGFFWRSSQRTPPERCSIRCGGGAQCWSRSS